MSEHKISCERARILMMGQLDGELGEVESRLLKEHLNSCENCSQQYEAFVQLKKGTSEMKFKPLPEMYWDEYWTHVYNKIERGISWILVSIGAILVLAYSLYQAMDEFFYNPAEPLIMKIGVGVLILGMIVLFVSVVREKLMVRPVDKYRSVKR
jgi:hypothetical protein